MRLATAERQLSIFRDAIPCDVDIASRSPGTCSRNQPAAYRSVTTAVAAKPFRAAREQPNYSVALNRENERGP